MSNRACIVFQDNKGKTGPVVFVNWNGGPNSVYTAIDALSDAKKLNTPIVAAQNLAVLFQRFFELDGGGQTPIVHEAKAFETIQTLETWSFIRIWNCTNLAKAEKLMMNADTSNGLYLVKLPIDRSKSYEVERCYATGAAGWSSKEEVRNEQDSWCDPSPSNDFRILAETSRELMECLKNMGYEDRQQLLQAAHDLNSRIAGLGYNSDERSTITEKVASKPRVYEGVISGLIGSKSDLDSILGSAQSTVAKAARLL